MNAKRPAEARREEAPGGRHSKRSHPGVTAADEAELDVLVHALAFDYWEHRKTCEACRCANIRGVHISRTGGDISPDPCPSWRRGSPTRTGVGLASTTHRSPTVGCDGATVALSTAAHVRDVCRARNCRPRSARSWMAAGRPVAVDRRDAAGAVRVSVDSNTIAFGDDTPLPDGALIVPAPSDPMAVARQFVAEKYTGSAGDVLLRHHRNTFYRYVGDHWPEDDERRVRSELWRWLETALLLEGVKKASRPSSSRSSRTSTRSRTCSRR